MSNLFPTYARWDVTPVSAKGAWLTDKNGKTYLDFTTGISVCNLGHVPDHVKQAVNDQLEKFWHTSNLFQIELQEEVAKQLTAASGLDLVFFANSGAEANEAAIKLARKATGRSKIITFVDSFHGRTFGTMAATGQEKIKTGFGPMLEKFEYVPFNDLEALKEALDTETAAVMFEVIQGEGGLNAGNPEFLRQTEEWAHKNGSLIIVDEVQTGIGRTGKPFAFQHIGLDPDIVSSAKGIASGLPLGAIIGKKELAEAFSPGSHGSTFGGNPISLAAAKATLETIFDESFLTQVEQKGDKLSSLLAEALSSVPQVKRLKGKGLMIGIELTEEAAPLLSAARQKGLLILTAGTNTIRLLPPLNVTEKEIEQAAALLIETIKEHACESTTKNG
ncbi:acetylornithine transaminase [Bacillus badius]|uniref:Acetylornithine aminotransferase n=1 Tax=Bacillus badius TaxID=1455 RepID=A0ABR5ARL4_BACBA|nr:acetylornithine transaminase [Bacillus badius]KIL72409.1 Acetylornithine aminotransferase [Bacillus badius]KIL77304.1 Acetylornithine aminotransferase [Bacillus badius]KZR58268.1 acetylornithine aminotransferase [Bacillus badius]MED4718534.1 acetylornithine transaminase [Bacillus badius]